MLVRLARQPRIRNAQEYQVAVYTGCESWPHLPDHFLTRLIDEYVRNQESLSLRRFAFTT